MYMHSPIIAVARLIIQRNSCLKFHVSYTVWLNLKYPTLYISLTHINKITSLILKLNTNNCKRIVWFWQKKFVFSHLHWDFL